MYNILISSGMTFITHVKRATTISSCLVVLTVVVLYCYNNNTATFLSDKSAATEAPVPYNISVFLESFKAIDTSALHRTFFSKFEKRIPTTCPLPNGGKCVVQHSNSTADVVFRTVRAASPSYPVRYWPGQIVAVLNIEADRSAYGIDTYGIQLLKKADIKIDHHPSSDAVFSEPCAFLPIDEWQRGELLSPDPKERKGIAMFSSDCRTQWEGFPERTRYYEQLMKLVHIDSYGKCWHNVPGVHKRGDDWREEFVNISRRYRMVLAFENIIEPDYITAKLPLIYRAGAIPVYRGPPEVYLWVPGNHSFIDAHKFTPEELAVYIKLIDTDDNLFRYHTSNFDIDRSRKRVETVCAKAHFMCRVCQLAHEIKVKRILDSGSQATRL